MVERYPGKAGRSEYGGGDGSPQRYPDGTAIPLEGLASGDAVSERARLMRMAGMADYDASRDDLVGLAAGALDVAGLSPAAREAYEIDVATSLVRKAERERLSEQTNGYIDIPAVYTGEEGADNGVEGFGDGA